MALAVARLALRLVETRIDGPGVARRAYAFACLVGVIGLIVLARAPEGVVGMAGVLLVGGVAITLTRSVSIVWVNRRATSDVRATVHSFLAQAEYLGEILLGIALALIARATSISIAMIGACALVACAGLLVVRSRAVSASSERA